MRIASVRPIRNVLLIALFSLPCADFAQQGAEPFFPAQPKHLTASASPTQKAAMNLVWDATSTTGTGPYTYNVYRISVNQSDFTPNGNTLPTQATTPSRPAVMTGITAQTWTDIVGTPQDYMYWVTAVDSAGRESRPTGQDYSCASNIYSGQADLPLVRPRVFLAAHGTNLYEISSPNYPADSSHNPSQWLINRPSSEWPVVAACLDGIWGNYANETVANETTLFNEINTLNVITEYDFDGNDDPSFTNADLFPANYASFLGPQTSATSPLVLNREGIAMYPDAKCDPTLWTKVTIPGATAIYESNPQQWDTYGAIYFGCGVANWIDPYDQDPNSHQDGRLPALSPIGAQNAFAASDGSFVECSSDACLDSTQNYDKALMNAVIKTHQKGDPFIAFFSFGDKTNPPKSGWLNDVQQTFQALSDLPCQGKYYLNGPDNPSVPYNECGPGQTKGLWQRNDIVLLIDYRGYYPVTNGSADANTNSSDNLTGILQWLLEQ